MLGLPFGKKKASPQAAAAKLPTAQRVQQLSSQGYSDPEIIRVLRTEGYSPQDADMAMKQAVRSAALPPQQPPPSSVQPGGPIQSPPQSARDPFGPDPFARQEPEPYQEEQQPPDRFGLTDLEIPKQEPGDDFLPPVGKKDDTKGDMEEIAEGLVEEKWGTFEGRIQEIDERVEKVSERIAALETAMAEFKGVKKTDVEQIKHSIDSYKENMSEVSERIEGMERAMKDSLTPMMQSLRSLSDTLKVLKSSK